MSNSVFTESVNQRIIGSHHLLFHEKIDMQLDLFQMRWIKIVIQGWRSPGSVIISVLRHDNYMSQGDTRWSSFIVLPGFLPSHHDLARKFVEGYTTTLFVTKEVCTCHCDFTTSVCCLLTLNTGAWKIWDSCLSWSYYIFNLCNGKCYAPALHGEDVTRTIQFNDISL